MPDPCFARTYVRISPPPRVISTSEFSGIERVMRHTPDLDHGSMRAYVMEGFVTSLEDHATLPRLGALS